MNRSNCIAIIFINPEIVVETLLLRLTVFLIEMKLYIIGRNGNLESQIFETVANTLWSIPHFLYHSQTSP